MLDKESIETYKNIRLHRDLRPEILERHEEKHSFSPVRFVRPAAALASLVLVVSVTVLASSRMGNGAYLDGRRITGREKPAVTETVAYAGGVMRAFALEGNGEEQPLQTADGCIPLDMRYGKDVCVTVSGGVLLLPGTDGIPTFAGQSGFAPDGAVIYWLPAGDESLSPLTAEIRDTEGNPIAALTLSYDADDTAWHIASEKIRNNK